VGRKNCENNLENNMRDFRIRGEAGSILCRLRVQVGYYENWRRCRDGIISSYSFERNRDFFIQKNDKQV
jgi:hypothetical protein